MSEKRRTFDRNRSSANGTAAVSHGSAAAAAAAAGASTSEETYTTEIFSPSPRAARTAASSRGVNAHDGGHQAAPKKRTTKAVSPGGGTARQSGPPAGEMDSSGLASSSLSGAGRHG